MTRPEPFDRTEPQFECERCGHRPPRGDRVRECPNCGSPMRNIATPQE